MTNEYRNKDMELFQQWKTTNSPQDLGSLVKQFEPLIFKEVRRAQGSVPPSALSAEAKKQTIRAFETYDPNKGAALSTHVYSYLQKVRRLNYKYQNAVRLPENQHLKFTDYNNALTSLQETLNRDPSDVEMAQQLGWSKKEVTRMKDRLFSDFFESGSQVASQFTSFDNTQVLKGLVEDNLDPQEKIIWRNVQVPKEQRKSVPELAAELGVDVNRLQYLKSKMVTKIRRLQTEMGEW